MEVAVFDAVEPDPSLQTVVKGAEAMLVHKPDWIVAVGGGSVMDAAKGMWILYEHPEIDPAAINPIDKINLRQKAHFAAVPTTSGTGSEATWAVVLTDLEEKRKLGLGNREVLPDMAILDPELVMNLPPRITADTGMDVLVHAIEGFTSTWHNDFSDGLCLNAARLVFEYLPRAFQNGRDIDARIHMQNAATIAGMGFGNSMAALAHGLGHALGADFHVPHGRAVGLFLPYSIEYAIRGEQNSTRYLPITRYLGLEARTENEAAVVLVDAVRTLSRSLSQPQTIADLGITLRDLESVLNHLASNALNDTQTIMGTRVPEIEDIHSLFYAAFHGTPIDF